MADGKVTYEVRADDSNFEGDLNAANSKAQSGASKLKGIATGAAVAIGTAFVAATAAAIKFGTSFEDSMAKASTLFGDVSVGADDLRKKMLELSDSTGVAADELGESLYNALSSGIPVTEDMGEALGFLEKSAKLAKAGFTDVDTAANATISTINAYGESVDKADKYQRILMQTQNKGKTTIGELGSVLAQVTPTAAAMGVSFEQVGAGIANMTAKGVPAAQATTQLNALFAELGKAGTTASKNLEKAAAGTKYAGMSFQEMMKAGVPLNEVLDLMNDYAGDNNLSMIDLFSSIEAGKAALLNSGEGAKGFSDALAAMGTEADVVGDAFDKVSGTTSEKFAKIMNQLKNSAIELFVSIQPLIAKALPILQELIQKLIPPIMEMVENLMPVFIDMFDALIPPLMDLIEAALPPLIDLFVLLIPPIVEIIQKVLPVLIQLFEKLMPPLIRLIEAILPPLIDIFDALIDPLLEMVDAILPILLQLWESLIPLIEALSPILSFLAEIIGEVLGGAIKAVMPLIQSVMDVLSGLIDFVTGIFSGNWERAWNGIVGIFKGIFNLIPMIVENIINGAIGLINGIVNGINKVTGLIGIPAIPNIPTVTLPRLKVGLDYVPEDDFPALLHRGEMVLTAEEAAAYRGERIIGALSGGVAASNSAASAITMPPVYLYADMERIASSINSEQFGTVMTQRNR